MGMDSELVSCPLVCSMGQLDRAMRGVMERVAWLTPSLQIPGGALPIIRSIVSLSVCYPTCSGHPDDTGEQTSCHTWLVAPALAVLSGGPRLSKTCNSLQVAWNRAQHCAGPALLPRQCCAGGGSQNSPSPNPCTYAQLGHGCTIHIPHSCFRTSVSPWPAHPAHEKKYICRLVCCLQTGPAFL